MDAPANPAVAALDGLIDRLHAQGRPRVWSLVITVFGDAIVPRGGRVALSVLQELTTRLRVEPGALRTAMSRLAADHWVTREREGRNSYYRLAEEGRHAFDLATRRIYAAGPPAWQGGWTVTVPPANGEGRNPQRDHWLHNNGFVRAGAGSWVRLETAEPDGDQDLPDDLLVIRGNALHIPFETGKLWGLPALAEAYRDFVQELAPLAEALAKGARLDPLDAMAARTLLNHGWRKIVLRDPGLPAALLPHDWPGEEVRALVREIYGRLAGPSESWLDGADLPPLIEPEKFKARFGGLSQMR
ncbi:PaaX family transcriptional regulator [Mesorhizobium xinjiangense]|uniref:PaaX family transcriptional regulator n=1 Tax=Mesorhizobium xinjiangense TaxID=2678685 RepID=UPI0012EE030D|nr:PaaX family transcriptional regulator C-terminal domain-containing protein [Mesorhizobium xinjiangense]